MKGEQDLKNLRREMRARNIGETHIGEEVKRDMRQKEDQEKLLKEETETHLGTDMRDRTEKEDKIDMTDKRK